MAASVTATMNSLSIMEGCNLAAANSLSELAQTVKEKGLWIFGESESKRRVITIEKKNGSYGFTLQSYGVRYKHGNRETDFITYVNAVEKDGAAFHAGLREGDVILSINGQNMARVEHRSLVSFIRKCPSHLKMVVVSDERARKVELHMRYVHLQKKLHDKMNELEQLNKKERDILTGSYESNSLKSVGGTCLADATSACCFCPSKSKLGFIDDKEKSKSMGSSDKTKNKDLHNSDCYRKTQSTKELHKEPSISSSLKLQVSSKTSDVGDSVPSSSTSGGVLALTKAGQGSNHCHHTHHHATTSTTVVPTAIGESIGQHKPKSWDNLMSTKSFGGYGFGFGYGYYPSNSKSGHSHFSHPHHHNHHTHCGSHPHYYSKSGTSCTKTQPQQAHGSHSRERRSSNETGIHGDQSSRQFTNYTTYKMIGTTRVVARVTMGNIDTSSGTCTRTLPSMRSSSSSRHTPDSSFSSKMEKTLSDSSLNSEHHKDFPKSMSYFTRGSENDSRFSSDDEYDEYATEPNYGGKHDIYV